MQLRRVYKSEFKVVPAEVAKVAWFFCKHTHGLPAKSCGAFSEKWTLKYFISATVRRKKLDYVSKFLSVGIFFPSSGRGQKALNVLKRKH